MGAIEDIPADKGNVMLIDELLGREDLFVADAVIHNSTVEGAKSRAPRASSAQHNSTPSSEL